MYFKITETLTLPWNLNFPPFQTKSFYKSSSASNAFIYSQFPPATYLMPRKITLVHQPAAAILMTEPFNLRPSFASSQGLEEPCDISAS